MKQAASAKKMAVENQKVQEEAARALEVAAEMEAKEEDELKKGVSYNAKLTSGSRGESHGGNSYQSFGTQRGGRGSCGKEEPSSR